jgi:hypothetical protein
MRGMDEAWAVLRFDFVPTPGSGGSVVSSEEDGPQVGHHWAGRTGPKGRLGILMRGKKMEWTSWAETGRWDIIED